MGMFSKVLGFGSVRSVTGELIGYGSTSGDGGNGIVLFTYVTVQPDDGPPLKIERLIAHNDLKADFGKRVTLWTQAKRSVHRGFKSVSFLLGKRNEHGFQRDPISPFGYLSMAVVLFAFAPIFVVCMNWLGILLLYPIYSSWFGPIMLAITFLLPIGICWRNALFMAMRGLNGRSISKESSRQQPGDAILVGI